MKALNTPKDTVTICRVAYCEKCHKNMRPNKGELFCTIGRTRQKYQVREVALFGQTGFTPHIMQIFSSGNGKITYTSYCAMDKCGCEMIFDEEKGNFTIIPIEYKNYTVTTKEWNAIVLYKDDSDYYLD